MPSMVPTGKRWAIGPQTHTTGIDTAGNAGPGWNVVFYTAKGDQGTVFIADREYNADTVRARVDAMVTELDATRELTG